MASISESIGATEVLVPYFCQARDGGYEYGSYSQYRAHLAIFQPIWRKGWHRPKLGIISYVISAFLPLFCQKVAKIDPSGRIRAIFSYKKAFETLVPPKWSHTRCWYDDEKIFVDVHTSGTHFHLRKLVNLGNFDPYARSETPPMCLLGAEPKFFLWDNTIGVQIPHCSETLGVHPTGTSPGPEYWWISK